jgi:hypothetical protein
VDGLWLRFWPYEDVPPRRLEQRADEVEQDDGQVPGQLDETN